MRKNHTTSKPLALTKGCARVVYKAMVTLNDIGARLEYVIRLPAGQTFTVYDGGTYGVSVNGNTREEYETLRDFALAYKLIRVPV